MFAAQFAHVALGPDAAFQRTLDASADWTRTAPAG